MSISSKTLKENLEKVLEDVAKSGQPVVVESNGREFQIEPKSGSNKLSRLVRRPGFVVGDPEELVHQDWSGVIDADLS